jgi:hypothetical protein
MSPITHGPTAEPKARTGTLEVPLDDVFCPCCQDDLASAIKQLPHVVDAQVDLKDKVAGVTVHPGMTDGTTLRRQVETSGTRCRCPRAEVS